MSIDTGTHEIVTDELCGDSTGAVIARKSFGVRARTVAASSPARVWRQSSPVAGARGSNGIDALLGGDPLTERTRATWMAGDFTFIAEGYAAGAAEFVRRTGVAPGTEVLDAACGTGNLALPASRLGGYVTGIDIAPNLIARARVATAVAGLNVRYDEGDVERLPYDDGQFGLVMSMFGAMFAPRPERALSELMRVTSPGGRIALASWTKEGFVGAMLRAHVALVPPPAGVPSVLEWGDRATMAERLKPFEDRIASVTMTPRMIELRFPVSPRSVVALFREYYGPTVRAFAALDIEGRKKLATDLLQLWTRRNVATGRETCVHSEYLDVQIQLR